MKEIEDRNNRNDSIIIHIFQLYQSAPESVCCDYIQEKRNKWEEGGKLEWNSII